MQESGFIAWVTGLKCHRGHRLPARSRKATSFHGYLAESVLVEVAEDLRDHPFSCSTCELCGYGLLPKYRLQYISEPRFFGEGSGKVVSVAVEELP